MTHDYKAAIEDGEKDGTSPQSCAEYLDLHGETINHALRIADKLMQEPSQKTKDVIQKRVGIDPEFDDYFIHDVDAEWIFEDIRDQLLKDIEDVATD